MAAATSSSSWSQIARSSGVMPIPRAIFDPAPGRPSLLAVERVSVTPAAMMGKATYPRLAAVRQVRCGQAGADDDSSGGTNRGQVGEMA